MLRLIKIMDQGCLSPKCKGPEDFRIPLEHQNIYWNCPEGFTVLQGPQKIGPLYCAGSAGMFPTPLLLSVKGPEIIRAALRATVKFT